MIEEFDEKSIIKELKIDAHALGIPTGAAETFINKTLEQTKKALKSKNTITKKDLERTITKELKKYHKDLAYVYENRDRII